MNTIYEFTDNYDPSSCAVEASPRLGAGDADSRGATLDAFQILRRQSASLLTVLLCRNLDITVPSINQININSTDSETKPRDAEPRETLDFNSFNPNSTGPNSTFYVK
ncbi:hypothetical protein EYF80_047316 [Liparis tanakae]|uniref:Uncharacterized protein n=1 Tax=Liparis tanakae TaxID=230148 RepID=A0A4Z2FQ79_9TELE|nr:hypothetical protein EYF80_047316 [Liparis tanakae]